MLRNFLEEEVCLYHPNAQWKREFEFESKGQKTSKKISNCSYITTYCLGGFQEKLSKLIEKQTIKYHNSIKYQQIKKQYKWLTLLEIL